VQQQGEEIRRVVHRIMKKMKNVATAPHFATSTHGCVNVEKKDMNDI